MRIGRAYSKAGRLIRKVARRVLPPEARSGSLQLDRPLVDAFIDSLAFDPSGIIQISGWSRVPFDISQSPSVLLDGENVPLLRHFRVGRPDVGTRSQTGLVVDYLVPETLLGRRCRVLTVKLPSGELLNFEVNATFINPDYRQLLYSTQVLHRDSIYGSGPPNIVVHPDVIDLAKKLSGPVLDFGCGRGLLVDCLQNSGIEAHGLELESEIIRQSIPTDRLPFITLYDGSLPSPFADGQFRSVMCSEVLEHIPAYQAAIHDIARIALETVIFTVPDASAIPVGFRHGCVPWHLLESTHVNFFTQESLQRALEPHFSSIEFGRIGQAYLNDSSYFVSLTATCSK